MTYSIAFFRRERYLGRSFFLTSMIYYSSSMRSSTWLIEDYEIIILIGKKSKSCDLFKETLSQ